MKMHSFYKTVQLILFLAMTVIAIVLIFTDQNVFHAVANDMTMTMLCILLWCSLGLSFVFIFLDFTFFLSYRKEYNELSYTANEDPLSGISNRFSCDMMVEKYLDKKLPENMGCMTFVISNMHQINRVYGHRAGNTLIRDFSIILRSTSQGYCFVGRNGGNNFLAIFENGSEDTMKSYLILLKQKVENHNALPKALPIQFNYGVAFHEGAQAETITDLIALSNKRVSDKGSEVIL